MPKPAVDLANQLISHIKYIEQTRKKSELLFADGAIVHRDISFVYSGLFLELVTSFERFIEDLFVGLLMQSLTLPPSKVHPKVTFISPKICREIIVGDRDYVDWLPYNKTLSRATAFFRNGMPFNKLTHAEKMAIQKISWIRNVIAHKSKHSYGKFENNVLDGLILTSRERTPVGYLRSVYIGFPNPQRRFEEIVTDICNISKSLTT